MKKNIWILILMGYFVTFSAQNLWAAPILFYTKPNVKTKSCDWFLFDAKNKEHRIFTSNSSGCPEKVIWDQTKQETYFLENQHAFSFHWKTPSQIQDLGPLPLPPKDISRFWLAKGEHLRIGYSVFKQENETESVDETESLAVQKLQAILDISANKISFAGKPYSLPRTSPILGETYCHGVAIVDEYQKGTWKHLAIQGTSACFPHMTYCDDMDCKGVDVIAERRKRADGLFVHGSLLQKQSSTFHPSDSFGTFDCDVKAHCDHQVGGVKLSPKTWILYDRLDSVSDHEVSSVPMTICQPKSECLKKNNDCHRENQCSLQKKLTFTENSQVEVVPQGKYALLRETSGSHLVLVEDGKLDPILVETQGSQGTWFPYSQLWNQAHSFSH